MFWIFSRTAEAAADPDPAVDVKAGLRGGRQQLKGGRTLVFTALPGRVRVDAGFRAEEIFRIEHERDGWN